MRPIRQVLLSAQEMVEVLGMRQYHVSYTVKLEDGSSAFGYANVIVNRGEIDVEEAKKKIEADLYEQTATKCNVIPLSFFELPRAPWWKRWLG